MINRYNTIFQEDQNTSSQPDSIIICFMKKVFALLCIAGIAFPYYYIFKFIEANHWEWSTSLFFEQINNNYAMSILNADLTVAATSFLIFLIYRLRVKAISNNQIIKYLVSLFVVGFSLALPLYLYDNYKEL